MADHAHRIDGQEEQGIVCCSHHGTNTSIERLLIFALIGGILVAVSVVTQLFTFSEDVATLPAVLGALLLAWPLLKAMFAEIMRGRPSSSTLAAIAVGAAMASGEYTTAGFLAFVLLVADLVLRRTAWGANKAIQELVGLTPNIARIVTEAGQEREAPLDEVVVGQIVRVRPGENLPVDGEVVDGHSTINQASLTGEAVPAEAWAGDPVYAGTTNLTGAIDIRVTAVAGDTTIGKVESLIREAESARTPRQQIVELVAGYYVYVALMVAGLVWFFSDKSVSADQMRATEKAISVLVVTCPGALLLASPTAMVAAFAAAARLGIMIKQTATLEAAATVDTVVFDKTGTMTTGHFAVAKLAPAPGVGGAELLAAAATGEQHSNHPLAKSILQTAASAKITPSASDSYEEVHGRGVRTKVADGEILVGRATWLLELQPESKEAHDAVESKIEGMTGVHVMRNGRYLGAVGLEDKLRSNAVGVVTRLRELGVRHLSLFTGDRFAVAKRVGRAVGTDHIEAECLPEEKHEQIRVMTERGQRVLMVGDGINDGPSLAAADVGVAMGLSGSDIATNSAGVALMNDDLARVPFLIRLARKTRSVVAQNMIAAVMIAVLGLTLAATGKLHIWWAVAYHFVGDIFVLANSFRLIRFGEDFAESVGERQMGAAEQPTRRAASAMLSTPVDTSSGSSSTQPT
ncbi:MAG: cadmium-translocating P-type ATPase [Phycisphaerales bacterium]|nr:cadmium-translocating P-type ATPase [Phycisphaerales bacterium]